MIKHMLFAWLFISLCVSASAQEYHTIKGIVVDANTSAPIAGVNIIGKYLYAKESKSSSTISSHFC